VRGKNQAHKREREMEKMKQDDENEEEATTVCQDFSDLFYSLPLSLFYRSVAETIFPRTGRERMN
jgi:hypothetical protein